MDEDAATVSPKLQLSSLQMEIKGQIRHFLVAADPKVFPGRTPRSDSVLGVGGATNSLLAWAPRNDVSSVLDLGCGGGVQALAAGMHARHVVGTDILGRALDIARINAALNTDLVVTGRVGTPATAALPQTAAQSAKNRRNATVLALTGKRATKGDVTPACNKFQWLQGDMLAPEAGRTFDLVVSNPPFVIEPAGSLTYRSGGRPGDSLIGELVRGIPAVLAEDGCAALILNWEVRGDWQQPWQQWLQGLPLDAWVGRRELLEPWQYVQMWLRDEGLTPDNPQYQQRFTAWVQDFAERSVSGIALGYVLLRKNSGQVVRRFEDAAGRAPTSEYAEHLWAVFRRASAGGLRQDSLEKSQFVVPRDVTEERYYRPGAEHPNVIMYHQGGGTGRQEQVDTALTGLLGACDGTMSIGTIIDALAQLLGQDRTALTDQLIPTVRDFYWWGFLRDRSEAVDCNDSDA